MNIYQTIAKELDIKEWQVEACAKLIDEGNTIPFIARYRKEVHGMLDDEKIRNLDERLTYLRNLEEKKAQVLATIEEQGALTPELRKAIEDAETLVKVEDLYRPYRPKRRTRATIAKEKGLEPLAQMILEQTTNVPIPELALSYVTKAEDIAKVKATGDKALLEKIVESPEDAIAGALDILAENVSDDADIRELIRRKTMELGLLVSKGKEKELSRDEKGVFEMYYDFEEPLKKLAGHRILATNRGENEKILGISITVPEEELLSAIEKKVILNDNPLTTPYLKEMIADAYKRLIAPSITNEIRSQLTETAEDDAIKVFGKNLEQLLMAPPIAGQVVLGWDPAFRTGCKIAVVDSTGRVLETTVIYPTAPQNKVEEAKAVIKHLIAKHKVTLISLGNGTASRESEQVIVELLKEIPVPVQYVIVNEAGASVYSASKLATEEFPNFDVGQRSATSMARRIQDPLAELVKIDPKSIGVGQYQHDMNQKKLSLALGGVVEDCVNKVGVDLNTASVSLLEYISGISKPIAKNIVDYRESNGRFSSRNELLKVAKLGPKAYEQCAGFLRIHSGKNPLDNTGVHPESYDATKALLSKLGYSLEDVAERRVSGISAKVTDLPVLAKELGIGEATLSDILKELEKPGRDPREDMPGPILRSDVLEMKDLAPGMVLKGTVRNVIDFGVFVDIGVHQDGLVHISEICSRFISHPLEAVKVGDIVDVKVLDVDLKKTRIALSMKGLNGDVIAENGPKKNAQGAGANANRSRQDAKGQNPGRKTAGGGKSFSEGRSSNGGKDSSAGRTANGGKGSSTGRPANSKGNSDSARSPKKGNHFFDHIIINP